jgi:hypothetical protein
MRADDERLFRRCVESNSQFRVAPFAVLHDDHVAPRGIRKRSAKLVDIRNRIRDHQPLALVLDPISALAKTGGVIAAVHASLRVLDLAKSLGITVLCTSLVASDDAIAETTSTQISTIADTWIHLAYLVRNGERNRTLTVVKSRGTAHSNQVRELLLSKNGITLTDVYTAGGEVLLGTARWEYEVGEPSAGEPRLPATPICAPLRWTNGNRPTCNRAQVGRSSRMHVTRACVDRS